MRSRRIHLRKHLPSSIDVGRAKRDGLHAIPRAQRNAIRRGLSFRRRQSLLLLLKSEQIGQTMPVSNLRLGRFLQQLRLCQHGHFWFIGVPHRLSLPLLLVIELSSLALLGGERRRDLCAFPQRRAIDVEIFALSRRWTRRRCAACSDDAARFQRGIDVFPRAIVATRASLLGACLALRRLARVGRRRVFRLVKVRVDYVLCVV